MSKKILKRSLALGALMAFVITGSVLAADYQDNTYQDNTVTKSTDHAYGYYSKNGIVTISNAKFINNKVEQETSGKYSYGGALYVIGGLTIKDSSFTNNSAYGVTSNAVHGGAVCHQDGALSIDNSIFDGNKVINPTNKDGISNDSYGAAIYSGGAGDVTIENSTFMNQDGGRAIYIKAGDGSSKTATFRNNMFLNNKRGSIQAENSNTTLNLEDRNEFKDNVDTTGVIAETLFNKGTTNFKSGSETIFSGNQLDIKNNGTINIENGADVILGDGGMVGKGTVNVAGNLSGKVFVLESDTAKTANSMVLNEGAIWNVTDDSVVSGIVSNGNVTIDGVDGNSLTVNNTITEKGKYAITHNSGTLTIKNLTIEDVIKEYNKQPANDNGLVYASVLYSNNDGKIYIEDSFIQNNSNTGDCKNYAIIDVTTNMEVKNTEFKNNESSYMGGVLYLHNKEFTITNSTFEGNTALQGAAMQTNSATVTLEGNTFKNNVATKNNDGDCGGAICAQGAGVITFKGTNTFEDNKANGTNGCGGAIAQYHNGTKIVFEKDSYTEFTNNTANGNGGAIWNGADAVIEVNGDLVFTGNTAGKKGNDIYNMSALKFLGGNTKVSGGIVSEGANAYVEISKDAVVELNGGTTSLNKLQGNGGVIHFSSADAQLAVVENTNETLKFTATSAVNEAVAGDANALISKVDWAADTTMVMEAGDIVGEITAELGENKDTGKLVVKSQTEAANPANQAISDAGVGLKLHYRYHMNDMNKRMGELRNANGERGVWTRMVRGESEYENSKAQYNQYQLGYDEKLSVDKRWTVGAAVTFSEGDSSYGYGSTEDKSTAFAIYGSKLNDDGTFVDLIARYAHLESDVEDQAGKGDYSTNGMSVSAEFGKRIEQGNGLWIEPQFELTYGNFDSAEFQIGGKTVQVGDMDSLIGRIGFSLGKDIKQGNVYARASYLYDFDGETETAFSNASATRTFKDDLGGGWWEVGVGANINLSKATYIYADVEKTFGGEVDTNWQWNLGVRYSF
ncbi:MAG: autotransporter outer membrane beta-barrel domain-containing protein [Phascolarctobacterium sp.]|nr:autotransporter outer membrane beta-barrel domain-containing protein [Phascolarctobacterium sp.]